MKAIFPILAVVLLAHLVESKHRPFPLTLHGIEEDEWLLQARTKQRFCGRQLIRIFNEICEDSNADVSVGDLLEKCCLNRCSRMDIAKYCIEHSNFDLFYELDN